MRSRPGDDSINFQIAQAALNRCRRLVDLIQQFGNRHPSWVARERCDNFVNCGGCRKRAVDEEFDNLVILRAVQEHDDGVVDTVTGAADLLIIGDDRPGTLEVNDKAQVGFVLAHAEGDGRDQGLNRVALQHLFALRPQHVVFRFIFQQ